ncbi:relaxase/mobilization nuclease domain-containing protein [Shimia sp. MMG029]|uniref:relaxase/mobilization nuclease domain-containing protein n=1 Tax=Shimia sp. MMG029 TaxID=3021978 RepID=UPI0022FED164|nr:relaxase/mobilization nuclease domain-containing protein [Shimia sp. MMG029]MDA5558697.1 relaxase/mobilization nuclease domain-containing protein [Shimia sp. MMG029]
MLIKFFGGTGGGSGIANYLIDPERSGREGAAPKVVRGDIARTVELIDAIDRKWKYTTGVLSFAIEDAPTEQQQNNLMDDFERVAFAGFANDRFDITWVRHSHTEGGRVELHFLTPRLDIATGKAFNVAPPGWERSYAPLRDAYNYEHGWARPDDPARARTQQRTSESSARLESREAITEYLEQKIVAGEISERADLVEALHAAGLETPRQGKSYVTAFDPATGDRWRLKGRIYESDWTREEELERTAKGGIEAKQGSPEDADAGRAAAARERLEAIIERRAEWVRERYPEPALGDSDLRDVQKEGDQSGSDGDPRAAQTVDRDERSDRGSCEQPVLDGAEPVGDVESPSSKHRNQRNGDVLGSAEQRGSGLELWRTALRKIGGLNDRESDDDREGAFGRIRELGSRIRGLGKNAISALQGLFRSDQNAGRAANQVGDAFEQSERSLGQTEQINDRLDREGAALERQVEVEKNLLQMELEFERKRVRELER